MSARNNSSYHYRAGRKGGPSKAADVLGEELYFNITKGEPLNIDKNATYPPAGPIGIAVSGVRPESPAGARKWKSRSYVLIFILLRGFNPTRRYGGLPLCFVVI